MTEDYSVYYCFVDVTVNEYISGTGPAMLTVVMHEETIWIALDEWPDIEQDFHQLYGNPNSRTDQYV